MVRRRARSARRVATILLGSAALSLGVPSTAFGQQSDFAVGFSSTAPATATGLLLHIVYRDPANPEGKPSPIRHLVITAPPGTTFNVGRVAACAASDQQIMAEGPAACPADTRVGAGTLTAITGFGPPADPYLTDVSIFNSGQGWIEVVQDHHTGATLATDRLQARGNTLTESPPATPGGPPDGQTAVRTIDFTFPQSTGYITSPPTCPVKHAWLTTASFTFANGTTQRVTSTPPCVSPREGSAPGAPNNPYPTSPRRTHSRIAVRVHAKPSRVSQGLTRITFRVRSALARCRRHALLRFAGHQVRTDRRGRVTLHIRLARPGRYVATAAHRGCAGGGTAITVVAR